jgi:hypothetical protein
VVARDATEKFLGASVVVMEGRVEPDTVEAFACKEGLALASDPVLRDFRLSCDNAGVIRSIQEGIMGSCGHIVQEIRARSRKFNFVEFVHEGRQSNFDAHVLARSSVYDDLDRHIWFVSPPNDVCTSYEAQ